MTTATTVPENPGWGRRRLLAVLASAATLSVLLVGGLVYAVVTSLTDTTTPSTTPPTPVPVPSSGPGWRERVAAAPMLGVGAAAARGGTPAATPGPTIAVPTATTQGPAGVPTGYPHTPAGALGQLAAIDTTVIAGMSVPHTTEVYQAWALPGTPPAQRWVMTGNVRAFLTATAAVSDPVVTATPVAAQVKGTDGQDWVVACVLLRVDAVAATTASVAYGHCEPMQWHAGRWMIAPGTRPAPAPSTWPGTDLAVAAGWATWVPTGGQD